MDVILLSVTGVSLALAAVMATLLMRTMREERRRSEARIALLSELSAEQAPVVEHNPIAFTPVQRTPSGFAEATADKPAFAKATVLRQAQGRPEQSRGAAGKQTGRFLVLDDPDDFDLRPAAEDVPGVHELFQEADEPSPWPRRLVVVGSLAAVITLMAFAWSSLDRWQTPAAAPAAEVSEVVIDAPLELLSLRHSIGEGALTITGLVENPRAGRELSNVKATLFVFGPAGSFITSGRAPLDFVSLRPGDESPFVIRVPVKGDVARYRVGFRGEDDRVLAHVDRRSPDAIAQK